MIKYTCGAGTPEEAEANCTYFIRGECTASFCEYRRKKQTNADCIRSMSDDDLANLLTDYSNNSGWVTEIGRKICFERIYEWLKQPSE